MTSAAPLVLASEPSVSLRWTGAGPESGCLGQRGLERAVAEVLGRGAFSESPADREIVVWVGARADMGYRALIRVQRGSEVLGERELVSEGASCASLDEPLSFAVALMVDGEAFAPPPAEPPPEAEPETDEAEPQLPFRRSAVDASLLGANALPEATLGLELGGEWLAWRWLGARVQLTGLLPRTTELGPAEARFGLLFGGLGVCPRLRAGPLTFAGCLGVEWGVLTADTRGFETDGGSTRRFIAGSAVLRVHLEVGARLSLVGSGGVWAPHDRERFVYSLDGERRVAFQMSALCPRIGLGMALAL